MLTFIEDKSQSTGAVFVCLILFSIACGIYLFVSSLSPTFASLWPLDMHFGLGCFETYKKLELYGIQGRKIFAWCEIIEISVYIPCYAICLSIASCALFRRVGFYRKTYVILLIAFVFDMVETSCLLYLVTTFTNSYTMACSFVQFVSIINMIKWSTGGAWIAVVLTGIAKLLVGS
jgi:hypothetical protein